jgi:hypothetical protein
MSRSSRTSTTRKIRSPAMKGRHKAIEKDSKIRRSIQINLKKTKKKRTSQLRNKRQRKAIAEVKASPKKI